MREYIMTERRKNRRIQLKSKIVIKCLDGTDDSEEVSIDVYDVSKSGIGFGCSAPLEVGNVYEAYLTIWTKEVIHAFIQIVRIDMGDEAFIYGGIFIGMSETDASRIAIYDTISSQTGE